MRQIQAALIMYAASWKDSYPVADHEAEALTILLRSEFVGSPEIFACPSSDQTPAVGLPSAVQLDSSNCSYAYSMNLGARSPAICAVLGDRSGANHGGGVHVGYNDGHVEWQELGPGQKLSELVATNNQRDRLYAKDLDDEWMTEDTDSWLRFRE
jgi:prepilin-type processing-associated H-X9-DG protein